MNAVFSETPMNDPTEHLINAVESSVSAFVGVTRGIINQRAEEEAEKYVSSTLGLDPESITFKLTKDQFIGMFVDKLKWQI